jgi:hypothetical protein
MGWGPGNHQWDGDQAISNGLGTRHSPLTNLMSDDSPQAAIKLEELKNTKSAKNLIPDDKVCGIKMMPLLQRLTPKSNTPAMGAHYYQDAF